MAAAVASTIGDGLNIDSAGLNRHLDAAESDAVTVAHEHDWDLRGHRPKQLTRELLEWADVVIVMESRMIPRVEEIYSDAVVGTLGEDVSDPYGRGIVRYRETWYQLERLVPPRLSDLP
jgi:protein-tyrosine-phosphatase